MAKGAKVLAAAAPAAPDYAEEARFRAAGFSRIAGVDEAGRAPLAGPVVAAAVILDPDAIPDGINDSKALAAPVREALFEAIVASSEVAVAYASVALIDRINIRAASLIAMRRALRALAKPADAAIVDGKDLPDGLVIPAKAVIGGDARCLSVAAASIVAKVARDRLMCCCDGRYAGYGLADHKGYPTAGHRLALTMLGPSAIHRRSFRGVAGGLADEARVGAVSDPAGSDVPSTIALPPRGGL